MTVFIAVPAPSGNRPGMSSGTRGNGGIRRQRFPLRNALMSTALALGLLQAAGLAAASTGQATTCETWVGDFATKQGAPAFFRIEHNDKGFVARTKQADGRWSAETVELVDVTHKPELEIAFAHGCVLAGAGALLIEAPKGTAYQATSITGRNFSTYHMGTDALMLVMQGFQVDGRDLYRVAAEGASPAPLPPLPKAIPGKEASSFVCPGMRPSAITQAAFDALPADYRKRFDGLKPDRQAEVICGQRLNDLLSLDAFTSVDLRADRAATLAEAKILLKAEEVPRDEAGKDTWWPAARHWLMRNTPLFDTDPPVPLQAEYFAAFNEDILPRLPNAPADDAQVVKDVVRYTLAMPQAQATYALARLQALGALDAQVSGGTVAHAVLPWALEPQVADAAFETIFKAAKVQPRDAVTLFFSVIDTKNAVGVNRLLKHGFDPRDAKVLLRARGQPALYATLLDAAFQRATPAGGKLPADVVDPLVQAELRNGKTIDWNAVEPLLKHGGDVSRSFITGVERDNASLAFFARSAPDKFLDMLNHGLRVDLPYPVGGNALLTRYLRLNIAWMPEGPRPDVVEAMLKRYNNAATGKPCTDCAYDPLGIALGNQGPNSVAVLKVLLRYGVDPNAPDTKGFPAFTYAIMDDRVDMLDAMMQGPKTLNLKLTDPNGFSLLALARCYDARKAADWLSQHGAGQPDQGYAACREGLAAQRKKG